MKTMSEEEFKKRYFEIISKPLPEDPEQLDFLYDRIVTLIEFTVNRAEYYENIRQENASTSNTLVAIAIAGLGLIVTLIANYDWTTHPYTYIFVPPLLVLLIGGTACVFKHHLDSNFQYPHQKYDWIEERWYFKKNIPAFEKMLSDKIPDESQTHEAFLSDLEREFDRHIDEDKETAIPLDKANLVILYIVTAYKKRFAKFISKIHTWSFILAGVSMAIFTLIYIFLVMPFVS
ncbi:MAG: hypothetical protein ACFFF9_13250 [Candidatus Thorarchaeota archaeon]